MPVTRKSFARHGCVPRGIRSSSYVRVFLGASVLLSLSCTLLRGAHAEDAARPEFFEGKIRPLLMSRCYECHHGEDAESSFSVDHLGGLLRGGERGPAIQPFDAKVSRLILAVRHDDEIDIKMPPTGKLTEAEIADLVAWIDAGAPWPEGDETSHWQDEGYRQHWAFQPLGDPQPPTGGDDWSDHPVDRFLRHQQIESGTAPVEQADPRTLLRRVYFSLNGLPPTFDEIEAFRRDNSPDAFARVVDNLLESPRYGERWGRHWMDVVRYADTAGDNADYPIPEIHLYRDYVIDSLNDDKPYDQFVREQLAGDILARAGSGDAYAEQIIATGFLALSRRYGTQPFELMHLTIEDAIETTGRAFLGLTLRCARCHDHKFDPITMEDYYGLYGIFASTQYPYTGSETLQSQQTPRSNLVPLGSEDQVGPAVEQHRQQIEQLKTDIKAIRSGELGQQLAAVENQSKELEKQSRIGNAAQPALEQLQQELEEVVARRNELHKVIEEKEKQLREKLPRSDLPTDLPAAYAVSEGEPRDHQVQRAGQPHDRGDVVPRGAPKFFAGDKSLMIPADHSGRQELAYWLTQPDSMVGALLARVMVNRVWQHHFGTGLVRTSSNFGLSGSPPTHPELLEYLARQFIESGWSVKALHRLIVSSKAYRLASHGAGQNQMIDPGNETYWHFARHRLDAESLRDAMILVSGTLDLQRPGAHPFPPPESWGWTQHNPFQDVYPSKHRSVYLMTQRFLRHPYLGLFDQPDTNTSTGRRTSATVPLQSLYLMNHPWIDQQATALASRILEIGPTVEVRIVRCYQLAYGRSPHEAEMKLCQTHLERVESELASQEIADPDRTLEKWASLAKVLLTSNEFLYVD